MSNNGQRGRYRAQFRFALSARSAPHTEARTERCIVGVSAASQNQEAKEKPPLHGDPAPQMKHFPPLHGDPAPQMKHFSPLHGMDRAIMKFSSPTHTQNAQFPTIFTVLGRYFFHRGTPNDRPVLCRGDLSFTQPLRGHSESPRRCLAAVPAGGGAWPDNESTRRAAYQQLASLVWRAPEGPEGTGGLRGAAPNEVRTPSLAGGRARRRPEHQRRPEHEHHHNQCFT